MWGFGGRYYWGREKENGGKREGIVVVFAWMSSEEKHVNRYVQLYYSLNWNSLVCHSQFLNMFFPEKAETLAFDILKELVEELKVKPCPVVFVSFSGGPKACMYKALQIIDGTCETQLNLDDRQLVRDCLSGYIYDSSPVDFTSDLGARFVVHPTVLNMSHPPRVISWIANGIASSLDALFLNRFESHRAEYWQTLYSSVTMGAPYLILCSEDDDLAPYQIIYNFAQRLRELGGDVKLVNWNGSPHVGHYRHYPIDYKAAVTELLGKAAAVYSQRIQRLEGERMGLEGTHDEIHPIDGMRKSGASPTQKSQANANSMQVYRLNDDGKWDDQGTGHVTVDYLERSEELGLFVIDEDDNETILLHRISPDDIYRKQEDTIISWRDPEYSTELALSFQETTGCSYIWDNICNVQRNLNFNSLNSETFHSMNSELRELPAVELSTLPLILKTLTESGIADQMRLTELILNDQEFFRKLMDLFRICEDLENIDNLHMIFKIVKGIILLNSPQIFEKIFGDELIMDIIGSLEYDPEVPHVQHHRNFLKEHVVFKEAIPIKDLLVLSKIHQTYRVGYLKDVVLARVLDESTVANLNSIIHGNNAIVVSLLKDDSTFIQELFARLRSPTTSAESKKNLVYFLHEFCSLSKSLQMVQQLRLFRDLMNEGIFDIITDALQSQDKKLVLTGTDILILFLNQDPNLLRTFVVRQEGVSLLGLLVKGMITDFGDDMHCQFLEILRSLLDSYTLSGAQRDTIIEIFYEKHLGQLIEVITASCPPKGIAQSIGEPGGTESTKPEILSNICELLCFCVLHHPYRIKCNFLLNNVMDKVLLLTQRREKYLVVATVRFVRTILSRHDEHLINHIVKNNLLKPIVDVFVANGNRYNLLNSAVLELFEYIRKENLKALLIYIVDSFWNQLANFEYLASMQSFKVKYEQCLETSGIKSNVNSVDQRKRIDERAPEKEEEDYFNEDSDEEDTASASHTQRAQAQPVLSNGVAATYAALSPRSGLVDYDDDEDDEDYRPPPRKHAETSEEDEGLEPLRLKRKLSSSNEKEPELVVKKQRLGKNSKARDSVFAALCSTLSQLPTKKTASSMQIIPRTADGNKGSGEENQPEESVNTRNSDNSSSSDEENHNREKESVASRNCSDCLHSSSDNGQLSGEDCPLIAPKSSPEMAVNGS